MSQLPPEVAPVAGAVLAHSFVCLLSGFFLLWMVWIHDERKSCTSSTPRSDLSHKLGH